MDVVAKLAWLCRCCYQLTQGASSEMKFPHALEATDG